MKLINTVTAGIAGLAMILGTPVFAASKTLEEVKARGILQCVVNPGLTGFAAPDDKGKWQNAACRKQASPSTRVFRWWVICR